MSRGGMTPDCLRVTSAIHLLDADALHIEGSASPYLAALDDCRERVPKFPGLRSTGDNIEMLSKPAAASWFDPARQTRDQMVWPFGPLLYKRNRDSCSLEDALTRAAAFPCVGGGFTD